MAQRRAVLAVWDPAEGEAFDIEIEWTAGPDRDARVKVPARFAGVWKAAAQAIMQSLRSEGEFAPFTASGYTIPLNRLTRSARGAWLIARDIWGAGVGWRVQPPSIPAEDPVPKGAEA